MFPNVEFEVLVRRLGEKAAAGDLHVVGVEAADLALVLVSIRPGDFCGMPRNKLSRSRERHLLNTEMIGVNTTVEG